MNYKLVLRKDRPNKQGECPLILDLTVSSNKERVRKATGILLHPSEWLDKKQEVSDKSPAYIQLDDVITKLKQKIKSQRVLFNKGDIDLNQLANRVTNTIDYSSLDDYLDNDLKPQLDPTTYIAYRGHINAIKSYTGFKGKELRFQDINKSFLHKFKREFNKGKKNNKPLSANTFNSYCASLRAVYNAASDDGHVYDKLQYGRKYRAGSKNTQFKQPTPEDYLKAVDNIDTLLQWEGMALWLLAFCCRGLLYADFTMFKNVSIDDYDKYSTWCENDAVFINHKRHKEKNKHNNIDMLIKLDSYPALQLLRTIKLSFAKRFYLIHPELVPDVNDTVRIYNYTLEENNKFHKELINSYQKAIRAVWSNPLKNARATFKNIAGEIKVGQRVADLLIGHIPESTLNSRSYSDYNTPEYTKQIQEAHEAVLKEFRVGELADKLFDRLKFITEKSYKIPSWIYTEGVFTDSSKNLYNIMGYDVDLGEQGYGRYDEYFKNKIEPYELDPDMPSYMKAVN